MPKNTNKSSASEEKDAQKSSKTAKRKFDYSQDYRTIDCRKNPEQYCIGKGEQGVLMVQPYKSEILPHWRFKTPEIARESSDKIYEMFKKYKSEDDFIGMDMARKFLMMGWTRSRRYANHSSGKKYSDTDKKTKKSKSELEKKAAKDAKDFNDRNKAHKLKTLTKEIAPYAPDSVKAESAAIFREKYLLAKSDPVYQRMSKEFLEQYG